MRYSIHKAFLSFLLAVLCLVTAGCGGGSSGGGSSLAGGGIGGTGITASGTITAFGSIFVNGIEFETAGAYRDVDGETSVSDGTDDETVLGIGMVVTVAGTLNADGVTGTAESIQYDNAVQGPVQGAITDVDQLTRRFTVMGIGVTMHKVNTVFADVTFDTLKTDDLVDISGFFDASGALLATRIERKTGSEIEVKGTVTGLAGASFTLSVEHAATTYSVDATVAELPAGGLADNQFVEVKGVLTGTDIKATRVELKREGFHDVEKASIEGIVTNFNGTNDFWVDGQRVNASAAEFNPASLEGGISNGAEVEVEGPIQGGVLMASKVEGRDGEIEIGARVLTVAPDAGGLTGDITLQFVPGVLTVALDSRTTLRDDTGMNDPLTLSNIHAGDVLQITAYRDGALEPLTATEIRRELSGYDRLAGPVDACVAGSHLSILGLDFALVDGATQYEGEEEASPSDSASFCTAQTTGGFPVRIEDMSPPDGTVDAVELEE
jgi:hypothetical protein